jgi:protoporphyrin/coproporphyrin ferrochelatase
MNLGSPDSTDVKDVKTYLTEFLMDKRVIDYPYLLRLLLIKGIIVPKRAPNSAEAYKSVWLPEGSPLIVLTKQLKEALEKETPLPIEIAMRYANPSPKVAFDNLQKNFPSLKEVLMVPLYPHYAMSSYETAVEYAEEIYRKGNYSFKISSVKPFYNEPEYIDALSDSIAPYLEQDYDQILFSYHGLPQRHMTKADPTHRHCMKVNDCCHVPSVAHKTCYRHQCFTTSEFVAKKLNIPKEKWANSFQSRLGREECFKPYTTVSLT